MPSKALVAASLKPVMLSFLHHGPAYGYEIIQYINALSEGNLAYTAGTLMNNQIGLSSAMIFDPASGRLVDLQEQTADVAERISAAAAEDDTLEMQTQAERADKLTISSNETARKLKLDECVAG